MHGSGGASVTDRILKIVQAGICTTRARWGGEEERARKEMMNKQV